MMMKILITFLANDAESVARQDAKVEMNVQQQQNRGEIKMTNWKYKVELHDVIEQCENEKITVEQLSKEVVRRLKTLESTISEKRYAETLNDIINRFDSCSDEDDFNEILNDLYDWGDTEINYSPSLIKNRLCWIGAAF